MIWSNGFNRCRPRRWLRGLKPSLHTTSSLSPAKKRRSGDRRLPGRSLWSNGFNRCRPRRWLRGLKPSLHTTSSSSPAKMATVRDRGLPVRSLWSNGFNRCRPRRWLRGLKPSLHTASRRRARPHFNSLGHSALAARVETLAPYGLAEARSRDKNFCFTLELSEGISYNLALGNELIAFEKRGLCYHNIASTKLRQPCHFLSPGLVASARLREGID